MNLYHIFVLSRHETIGFDLSESKIDPPRNNFRLYGYLLRTIVVKHSSMQLANEVNELFTTLLQEGNQPRCPS